jgi:tetratricopeptide (TPR) repeat protein
MHLEARNCLERMVKLDPNYVEISVWLALIYLDEYRYGHNPYPQPPALDRALEAALQAVSLDPTSTMAHYSLASVYFFRNELERFAQETEKALTLNPNNALVLAELGNYLGSIGEFEQSMALTQKAMALNPSFPGWYWATVFNYHYHYTHDYEKALTAAQEWNEPNFYWDQVHLAQAYAQLERKEEALAAVKKLLELYPEFLQNAREEFLMWNYSEDMIEHEINGLRKAGLEIPLEE